MLGHWYTLLLVEPAPPALPAVERFDYLQLLQAPPLAPPQLLRVAQHLQMLRDIRLRRPRRR
ncbi:MAG: hypothetical protein J0M00_20120 [Burkholderiales bacterium]|nr:hypothetical protein [Burkholderiales bacterium]